MDNEYSATLLRKSNRDLKELCKRNNLLISGNKKDMVRRLVTKKYDDSHKKPDADGSLSSHRPSNNSSVGKRKRAPEISAEGGRDGGEGDSAPRTKKMKLEKGGDRPAQDLPAQEVLRRILKFRNPHPILVPGRHALVTAYKGKDYFADLSADGAISYTHAKGAPPTTFTSPSTFSSHIIETVQKEMDRKGNRTRKFLTSDGWLEVKYVNKEENERVPLDTLRAIAGLTPRKHARKLNVVKTSYSEAMYEEEYWETLKGSKEDEKNAKLEDDIIQQCCPRLIEDDYTASSKHLKAVKDMVKDGTIGTVGFDAKEIDKSGLIVKVTETTVNVDGSELVRSIKLSLEGTFNDVQLDETWKKSVRCELWHDWSKVVDALGVFKPIEKNRNYFLARVASQLRYRAIPAGAEFDEGKLDCDFMILAEGELKHAKHLDSGDLSLGELGISRASRFAQLTAPSVLGEAAILFEDGVRSETVKLQNVFGEEAEYLLAEPRVFKAACKCKCFYLPKGCFQPIVRYVREHSKREVNLQYIEVVFRILKTHLAGQRAFKNSMLARGMPTNVLLSNVRPPASSLNEKDFGLHPWEIPKGEELGGSKRAAPPVLVDFVRERNGARAAAPKGLAESSGRVKAEGGATRTVRGQGIAERSVGIPLPDLGMGHAFMEWVAAEQRTVGEICDYATQRKDVERIMRRVRKCDRSGNVLAIHKYQRARKEEQRRCPNCHNTDPLLFENASKKGIVTCKQCGFVCERKTEIAGAARRTFEGEEDKNHNGPPQSNRRGKNYNIGTNVMSAKALPGAKGADKSTGEGFKNEQKDAAEKKLKQVCGSLKLGNKVRERAMDLFSDFRDEKDKVIKPQGVEAACLLLATREHYKNLKQYKSDDVVEFVNGIALPLSVVQAQGWWSSVSRESKFSMIALKVLLLAKTAEKRGRDLAVLGDRLKTVPIFVHVPAGLSKEEGAAYVADAAKGYGCAVPTPSNVVGLKPQVVRIDTEGIPDAVRAKGDLKCMGGAANEVWNIVKPETGHPATWCRRANEALQGDQPEYVRRRRAIARWWWSLPLLHKDFKNLGFYYEHMSLVQCVRKEHLVRDEVVEKHDGDRTGVVRLADFVGVLQDLKILHVPTFLLQHFIFAHETRPYGYPSNGVAPEHFSIQGGPAEESGELLVSYGEFLFFCKHRGALDDPTGMAQLDGLLGNSEDTGLKENSGLALRALDKVEAARDQLYKGWKAFRKHVEEGDNEKGAKRAEVERNYEEMGEREYYQFLKKNAAHARVVREDYRTYYCGNHSLNRQSKETTDGKVLRGLLRSLYAIDQDNYLKGLLGQKGVFLTRSIVWGQEATLRGWRKASEAPSPFPTLFPAIDNLANVLKREAGQHKVDSGHVALFARTGAFWKQGVALMTPALELHAYHGEVNHHVMGRHGPDAAYENRIHRKDRPSQGFKKKEFVKY